MIEIRKGTIITPSKLRSIFTKIFQFINEVDSTTLSLTTGQVVATKAPSITSDLLSVYSDQYFKTDITPEQYATKDVSFLQRYLDDLNDLEREV